MIGFINIFKHVWYHCYIWDNKNFIDQFKRKVKHIVNQEHKTWTHSMKTKGEPGSLGFHLDLYMWHIYVWATASS